MTIELNAVQRLVTEETLVVANNDSEKLSVAFIQHNYTLPLFDISVDGGTGRVYAKQSTGKNTDRITVYLKMQGQKEIRIGFFDHPERYRIEDLKDYIKDELIDESTIKHSL